MPLDDILIHSVKGFLDHEEADMKKAWPEIFKRALAELNATLVAGKAAGSIQIKPMSEELRAKLYGL